MLNIENGTMNISIDRLLDGRLVEQPVYEPFMTKDEMRIAREACRVFMDQLFHLIESNQVEESKEVRYMMFKLDDLVGRLTIL